MGQGLKMVIGMSIAYLASFAGLILAYRYYKKYRGRA
jgi:hypothetical protein